MSRLLQLRVNGESHTVATKDNRTLAKVLREDLGLLGTKDACGEGTCGACTVLLDGRPVLSCLTLAVGCEGHEITTIEGLSDGRHLHPVQAAFVDKGAIQCGMCSPGMIMSAVALLDQNSDPSETEVREALAGNLCRCTGYKKIVDAVLFAAADQGEAQ
jgi:carbon-monoxide dehydrogenase small subunit